MLSPLLAALLLQNAPATERPTEEILVSAPRTRALADSGIAAGSVEQQQIAVTAPTHANELFFRFPATWISRGSGQESLTALRSPVLTGAGACGAFQVIEDGVPIRPTGFCNANDLFEVNLAQADSVSVYRGPSAAIEGSNALHGTIAVQSLRPQMTRKLSIEGGTDDYYRFLGTVSGAYAALALNLTDSDSFRDDEQYRHAHLNAAWQSSVGETDVLTTFSATDLDQDTAGYVPGRNAYADPVLRTQNLNPEAFRKARAYRLVSIWTRDSGHSTQSWTPYIRHSRMEFLQHFLPGKPLERNGQDSLGLRWAWRRDDGWSAGIDGEWALGDLLEYQEKPLSEGSAFLRETRPQGFHYDYDVRSTALGAWAQKIFYIQEYLQLTAALRYEFLHYRYDNRMLSGNTRDDGTACGFSGCLYTRPADRSDRFSTLAPELTARHDLGNGRQFALRMARGFRAPQATELYRLQSGQEVSDLEVTTIDSVELSLRTERPRHAWSLTAFHMRKNHDIFRDASGYNVSDGETHHSGLEADVDWSASDTLSLNGNVTWARHTYAFDRAAGGGEVIRDGNRVDTAPDWLGSLRLNWRPAPGRWFEAEWTYTGAHFIDAANRHRYGGHDLLNLRAVFDLPGGASRIGLRISNVLDAAYAERADYAFGNYRYFPGAGRRFFISWQMSF